MDTSEKTTLYQRLASIGIAVSQKEIRDPFTDIEKTLIDGISAINKDSRLLGLLLSWIAIHGSRVNVERIKKLNKNSPSPWWHLLAKFALYKGFRRWKLLLDPPSDKMTHGDFNSAVSRIRLRGEEEWAKNSGFLIPKGSEEISSKYALSPEQLIHLNRHYKNKLLYGANWRADVATAMEAGAKNPYQISKVTGASYESAYRIFNELRQVGLGWRHLKNKLSKEEVI